jgi:hypothetical protein
LCLPSVCAPSPFHLITVRCASGGRRCGKEGARKANCSGRERWATQPSQTKRPEQTNLRAKHPASKNQDRDGNREEPKSSGWLGKLRPEKLSNVWAPPLRCCPSNLPAPPHPTLPKQEFSVLQTASLLKTNVVASTPAASATTRTFCVCGVPPWSVPLIVEKQDKMVWTCK